MHRAICLILLSCLVASGAYGQFRSAEVVTVSAQWDQPRAHPGGERVLAVVLDIAERYHVNAEAGQIPPGEDFLIPTSLKLTASEGGDLPLAPGATQFPEPKWMDFGFSLSGSELPVYEGRAVIYLPVTVADDAEPGEVAATVAVRIQACDDKVCLPPETVERVVPLTIVPPDVAIDEAPADPALFAGYVPGAGVSGQAAPTEALPGTVASLPLTELLLALLLALVGGAVLNVMPCVLPVIPIKIMGLVQATPDAGRRVRLGLVMSLGVLSFWVVLGLAIASLTNFKAISSMFGYWWFNIGLGVLLVVLAIGMCGLFSIRLPAWVYRVNPSHDSYSGSFGFGVMTAVLATPCTGPFMGGAAGTVLATGPIVAFSIFAAIGVGMAVPYLVLSAWPGLVERIPRTGPASELVKQVLGMLILAAAAFFFGAGINSLLHDGTGSIYQWYWWLCSGIIAAAGLWVIVQTIRITPSMARRLGFGVGAAVMAVASVAFAYDATRPSDIDWVYYTPEAFERAQAQRQVVVMDFTADWCINCKVLERTQLEKPPVIAALAEADVIPMKVDLTGSNEVGWAKLNAVGRVAIPLLVVFSPDGDEVFKAEVYTTAQVVDAIRRAQGAADAR